MVGFVRVSLYILEFDCKGDGNVEGFEDCWVLKGAPRLQTPEKLRLWML
jgi:hypothetical protein